MTQIVRSIKGTRDYYPDEMTRRQWLIGKAREASELYGYEHYDGPCLESLELYAAKSGEELVKEQAFVFPDRGGDLIILRPELTPTLARMVAQKQNELVFPLRWWSFGPFWRYERPQKGRTREFFQWNIDLIGDDSLMADAELIAVAAKFLKLIGLTSETVKLKINNRHLMEAVFNRLGIPTEIAPSVLKMIDKIDKLPAAVWDEKVLELGLSSSQLDQIKSVLGNSELWRESVELVELFDILKGLGAMDYIVYDPKIIRGLDYYTGTVFEAYDTKSEFRAILGGGHYANLVADVGGNPLPGVGFAMGDVVINLVLEANGLYPERLAEKDAIFVTVFNADLKFKSLAIAARLREAGLKVVMNLYDEKLTKQLKFADRLGLGKAIVIGPDEAAAGQVVVKNLRTREQEVINEAGLLVSLGR
jgi:histidyl-tRNA synthetase